MKRRVRAEPEKPLPIVPDLLDPLMTLLVTSRSSKFLSSIPVIKLRRLESLVMGSSTILPQVSILTEHEKRPCTDVSNPTFPSDLIFSSRIMGGEECPWDVSSVGAAGPFRHPAQVSDICRLRINVMHHKSFSRSRGSQVCRIDVGSAICQPRYMLGMSRIPGSTGVDSSIDRTNA